MLGDSPYRIEIFVSEVDIPKVQTTQSGSIELDAFPGVNFALRVSQVDAAPTDRDGVSKYRVRLDFVYPHEELKIGMTGDASITTGERKNVVSVPSRSVIESSDGEDVVRLLQDDGTIKEVPVQTGMESENGNVEVTGVQSGATVVVLIKQ
jgi:HlyD family secretion protein